jgi:hypothetical protein
LWRYKREKETKRRLICKRKEFVLVIILCGGISKDVSSGSFFCPGVEEKDLF